MNVFLEKIGRPDPVSGDIVHYQYDIRGRYVGTEYLLGLVTEDSVRDVLRLDNVSITDNEDNSIDVKELYLDALGSGIADCKKLLKEGGVIDSVGRVIAEYSDVSQLSKEGTAALDKRRDKLPTSGADYKERLERDGFYRGTAQGLMRNGIMVNRGLDYENLPTVKKICIIKPGLSKQTVLAEDGSLCLFGRCLVFGYQDLQPAL